MSKRTYLEKVLFLCIISLTIFGCGVNKVKIAQTTNEPKELFVNLSNDPLLISIEIKTILEMNGYKVALNTEESHKSIKIKEGEKDIIYQNVSNSNYRYELVLGYRPVHDKIELIAASVRDRENDKILGTYRWSWDRTWTVAPTIEKAIEMVHSNLLMKIFGS